MYKSLIAVALPVLTAIPLASQADVIFFTNRAEWRTAAGGAPGDRQEGFDSFANSSVSYASSAVTAGFLTFSANGPGSNYHTIAFGEANIRVADTVFTTRVSFEPTRAFGFDFSRSIAVQNGILEMIAEPYGGNIPVDAASGFIGLLATDSESFSSVWFRSNANMVYTSDNWEAYSLSSAVPEPSSLSLLFSGVACLGLLLRRRTHFEKLNEFGRLNASDASQETPRK